MPDCFKIVGTAFSYKKNRSRFGAYKGYGNDFDFRTFVHLKIVKLITINFILRRWSGNPKLARTIPFI